MRYAILVALALLSISACNEPASNVDGGQHVSYDAATPSDAMPSCTHDEDCAELGPYGYCRFDPQVSPVPPGALGICVID